jgi:hypothetical protein
MATVSYGIPRLSRSRNNADDGLFIELGAIVSDLVLGIGDTPASAMRIATSVLPAINSLWTALDPTATTSPWIDAFLWDINPRGIIQADDSLEVVLTYFAPTDFGGGPPTWEVEDVGSNSIIQTFCTADGSENIYAFYTPGAAIDADPTEPYFTGTVAKVVGDRAVRKTARMSKDHWDLIKDDIRAAACRINNDTWGGYERGTWLFLYANSTLDSNGNLVVALNFAYKEDGWWQFLAYMDITSGQPLKPDDSATEADLRTAGPPAEGSQIVYNGMTMVSVQREADFAGTFPFTPD